MRWNKSANAPRQALDLRQLVGAERAEVLPRDGGAVACGRDFLRRLVSFALHTGQIILLTKQLAPGRIRFYEDAGGLAIPRWREQT